MPRSRTAKQFEVVANPATRTRRQFPYLIVLQSDFAHTGNERVVAPLSPKSLMAPVTERLFPIVDLNGSQYRLLVPALTSIRIDGLRQPVGNLDHARSAIVAALDYLFLGF